jgi:hypothetical protein
MANLNPNPSTRFGPNNNANPTGKKGLTVAGRFRKVLERASAERDPADRERFLAEADLIIEAALASARNGDWKAGEWLFDRGYGKLTDKRKVQSSGGFTIIVNKVNGLNTNDLRLASSPAGDLNGDEAI